MEREKFIAKTFEKELIKIIEEARINVKISTSVLQERECHPRFIEFYRQGAEDVIEILVEMVSDSNAKSRDWEVNNLWALLNFYSLVYYFVSYFV